MRMNRRLCRVYRQGTGLVVVIPADWVRGMGVVPGDDLIMSYNGKIVLQKPVRLVEAGP